MGEELAGWCRRRLGAEPVVAGLAAAVWPADGTPDRAATLQQTEQFVAAYEQARGRRGGRTRRQGRPGGGGGRVAWAQGRVAGEVGVAWA